MPPGSVPQGTVPPVPEAPVYLSATAGQRLANYILDGIGTYIFSFFVGSIVGLIGVSDGILLFIIGLLSGPVYYMFFEGIWQRSPGKYVTRTKVVARDGSKPEFSHIVGRSFARIVPFEPLSFLFSSHPVGWHDRWTDTLVVDKAYTPENVQKIDTAHGGKSSGAMLAIIAVVALVVIAVIGVMASVVLASLNVAREKGRDAERVTDIKQIELGLEQYYASNNAYPESLDQLVPDDIAMVPQDPSGGAYDYYSCGPSVYHLGASLEDPTSPALAEAAQAAPMCSQDPIQGNGKGACVSTDTGSYCFDVTQDTSGGSTASPDSSGSQ